MKQHFILSNDTSLNLKTLDNLWKVEVYKNQGLTEFSVRP